MSSIRKFKRTAYKNAMKRDGVKLPKKTSLSQAMEKTGNITKIVKGK